MFKHIPILSVFVFWTSIFYSRITIESYKYTWYHMISSLFGPSFPQVWRWLQHQYPLHRASANGLRSMSQRLGRDLRPTMSGRANWGFEGWTRLVVEYFTFIFNIIQPSILGWSFWHNFTLISPRPIFFGAHIGEWWCLRSLRWKTRFCIFTIARWFAEKQSISFTNILHLQISVCVCVYKCT